MNYYELLGIDRTASFDDIKKAYFGRRKTIDDELLEQLEVAYRTLSSKSKRADYDASLDENSREIDLGKMTGNDLYNMIDVDAKDKKIVVTLDDNGKASSYRMDTIDSEETYNEDEEIRNSFSNLGNILINEEELDLEEELKLTLTPSEISRALANLVKDDDEEYIEGTNVVKPRNRNINETDKEYESYLEKYYNEHFYIPGTTILKPRDRKINESIEEYESYLKDYYQIIFASKKEEKEELQEVTKREKHPRLKKFIRGALVAGAIILGVLGIRSCAKKAATEDKKEPVSITSEKDDYDDIYGSNTTVDTAIDDASKTLEEEQEEEEEKDMSVFFEEIDPHVHVGDRFYLHDVTLLYTASTDSDSSSFIGNHAEEGVYGIDKIVVLDKDNNIVANSSFDDIDTTSYDDSYKIMYHFSKDINIDDIESNRIEKNTDKNVGWVFSEDLVLEQRIDNIVENAKVK